MKKIMILYTVILIFGIFLIGCSKEENTHNQDDLSDSIQFSLFDSLQGNWEWQKTYDAKKGIIENEFESFITFLSVNQDSSINFETIKEGTTYKTGKFNITKAQFGYRLSQSIIPNYTPTDENYINFLTKDSLSIYENGNDNPRYYYKKLY